MTASIERRRVFFTGMVQGVGFRYTARRIALRFPVSGYVQNLPDGRVQIVAEGTADEIGRFLVAVESELGRYVTSTEQEDLQATGDLKSFDIRF
jgi:acylphosphatase